MTAAPWADKLIVSARTAGGQVVAAAIAGEHKRRDHPPCRTSAKDFNRSRKCYDRQFATSIIFISLSDHARRKRAPHREPDYTAIRERGMAIERRRRQRAAL